MDGFKRKRLVGLVFWLVVTALGGCAGVDRAVTKLSGEETTDVVPGIVPPAQRIANLRKIRQKSAWAKPDEQEKLSGELAAAFQQETDPMIRVEIVQAASGYPTDTAASVLRAGLDDPDLDVRVAACTGWGNRGGPEAVALLSGVLAGDVDTDVRLAAAGALGQTGDPGAVPALGQALEESDPAMQYRAVSSLREITDQDFGNDVNRWRQYVKGEVSSPNKPVSVAERFRRMF